METSEETYTKATLGNIRNNTREELRVLGVIATDAVLIMIASLLCKHRWPSACLLQRLILMT